MMVSVLMITYGHDKYIHQAIEGVLMQQTDFDFELIIANDNSPDNSHSIIVDIITNHEKGKIINYLNRSVNLGMQHNFVDAYSHCTGKYIALCEGDDYWTDPLKLQKQVDFLEDNPEFVVCYHDCSIIDFDGKLKTQSFLNVHKKDYSKLELKKGAWMPTLTRCFKNVIKQYPASFEKVNCGDLFLTSLLGFHGKAKYLDFNGANYREHNSGVWSGVSENTRIKKMISDYVILYDFHHGYNKSVSLFFKNSLNKTFEQDIRLNGLLKSASYNLQRNFKFFLLFLLDKSFNKIKLLF